MTRQPPSKADAILDAAETMVRLRGYDAVSFRDIAAAVGIKSASVHYHFATKATLGTAVARRYTDRFLAALGAPDDPQTTAEEKLARYIAAYRSALVDDGQMCLCGMLGAEVSGLPEDVADEARRFFDLNLDWLATAVGAADAHLVLAALEGALIVARATGDLAAFDRVAKRLSAI